MKYIIVNGSLDYTYIKKEKNYKTKHILYYSDNTEWNEAIRNTKACEITDTGNGLIINSRFMDYSEALELTILLNLINDSNYYICENITRFEAMS